MLAYLMTLTVSFQFSMWLMCIIHMTQMNWLNWKTPLELLKGEKASVSHLCMFRCGAYVHLPDETHKGKLQPKSQLMVYLSAGARSEHNCFTLLHISF